MLPMTYRTEDPYHPGFRFLAGFYGLPLVSRGYGHAMQAAELHTVTSREGEIVHTVDDAGVAHRHIKRPGQELEIGQNNLRQTRTVMWNLQLPDLPADSIRIMADALKSHTRPPPLLLLCIEETSEGVLCERVNSADNNNETRYGEVDEGDIQGNAFFAKGRVLLGQECDRNEGEQNQFFTKRSFPKVSPQAGDLLIAINPEYTEAEDPAFIKAAYLFRLASGMDRETVGRALPKALERQEGQFAPYGLMFADLDDVQDGIGRGIARKEPNDIIVISVPETDKDEVNLSHISHRGIRLYDSDNLDDDLWGTDLEPGIWIGEDVTWFNCGDDGAEWEASWRRATSQDLESYGIDIDEITESWNDLDLAPITKEEVARMIAEGCGPNSVEADVAD